MSRRVSRRGCGEAVLRSSGCVVVVAAAAAVAGGVTGTTVWLWEMEGGVTSLRFCVLYLSVPKETRRPNALETAVRVVAFMGLSVP